MINPFEHPANTEPRKIIEDTNKEKFIFLFCMFPNKKTEKLKSTNIQILVDYINNNKDILYFNICSKAVVADQYDTLE